MPQTAKKARLTHKLKPHTKKNLPTVAVAVAVAQPHVMAEVRMVIETKKDALAEIADMPELSDVSSVKTVACQLLVAVHFPGKTKDDWKIGFSFNSILMRIGQLFPDAKTSEKCLRWYLMRIRQEDKGFAGYVMLTRFQRPKSKTSATLNRLT